VKYSGGELKLINRVYGLFQDNLSCVEAWGFYLFSEELDNEQELRNRLGTIWLASLFDSVNAQTNLIAKYSEQASELNLIHIPRYCNQASVFIDSVKGILQKYTVAEQLFIQSLRNQWVHSHLSGRHEDSIRVKYVENDSLINKNLPHDEYHEIMRPLFEQGNLDVTLKEFVTRFTDQTDDYWVILNEIQESHRIMYQAMLKGSEFQWRAICV